MESIAIDGNGSDWADGGFRVLAMLNREGQALPRESIAADFALGWSGDGLLVLIRVQDDEFIESDMADQLWTNDCVELFFADAVGSPTYYQAILSPGMAEAHPQPRMQVLHHGRPVPPSIAFARQRHESGYVLEARLPWPEPTMRAAIGRELGFQLFVDDADQGSRQEHLVWFPAVNTSGDPRRMHRIRLADAAAPPVRVAARGPATVAPGLLIRVVADTSLAGAELRLEHEGQVLAAHRVPQASEPGAFHMEWKAPPANQAHRWYELAASDQVVGHFLLGDPFTVRAAPRVAARTRVATASPPSRPGSQSGSARTFLISATVIVGIFMVVAVAAMLWSRRTMRIDDV